MQEIKLREKQKLMIDMMERLQPIFAENDIQYWAASGTLLGAVRHHGFIPWDDDMDILVPIDSYIRMIHILEKQEVFFESINLTIKPFGRGKKLYHKRFKIADTRTVNEEFGEIRPAVYIDFFPVVHIHSKNISFQKRKLQEVANFAAYYHSDGEIARGLKKPAYYLINLLFKCFGKANEEYFEKILCRSSINGMDGTLVYLEGADTPKESWPARCFAETIYLDFETIKMPIPAGYDEVLSIWFGDYMTLPPENERKTHSQYKMYWK